MPTTIIFGSRGINDPVVLEEVIKSSGFQISEVVEGECPNSPDVLGRDWAKKNNIPIKPFPADWNDLSHPKAVIRTNRNGKQYDAAAGFRRNKAMAKYAAQQPNPQAIGIIVKGGSGGSENMKRLCLDNNLRVYFHYVEPLVQ